MPFGKAFSGSTSLAGAMVVDPGTVVVVLALRGSAVFAMVVELPPIEVGLDVDGALDDDPLVPVVDEPPVVEEPLAVVVDEVDEPPPAVVDDAEERPVVDDAVVLDVELLDVDDTTVGDDPPVDGALVSAGALELPSAANAGAEEIAAVATIDSITVLRDIPSYGRTSTTQSEARTALFPH